MATVPSILSYQITDEFGSVATDWFYVDVLTTETVAQMVTFAQNGAAVTDPLTDGQITAIEYKLIVPIPGGLKSAPVSGAEIERVGLFNFSQEGAPKPYKEGIAIPAFAVGKLLNGKINLADTDVAAWVNFIEAISSTFQIVSKFGFLLPSLIDALMSFRKHRKSLTKRSFEVGT
jgi:hypothetical protein